MVCNLIEHLALDQSEHDKSLRYGKIYFSLPRATINESGMYINYVHYLLGRDL